MPTTNYHWSSVLDCVMHETDEFGDTTVEYTHEPSHYGPLLSERREGTEYVHHYDALGSTTALADETGEVTDTFGYDAWGNNVFRTGETDTTQQWIGRWGYSRNAIHNLFYVRRRYYHPRAGQWMTVDPVSVVEAVLSRYQYAKPNPVTHFDPSGLYPKFRVTGVEFDGAIALHATVGGNAEYLWKWKLTGADYDKKPIALDEVSILQDIEGSGWAYTESRKFYKTFTLSYREILAEGVFDVQGIGYGDPMGLCDKGNLEQTGVVYLARQSDTKNPVQPPTDTLPTRIDNTGSRYDDIQVRSSILGIPWYFSIGGYPKTTEHYAPDIYTKPLDKPYSLDKYERVAWHSTSLSYGVNSDGKSTWCYLKFEFHGGGYYFNKSSHLNPCPLGSSSEIERRDQPPFRPPSYPG